MKLQLPKRQAFPTVTLPILHLWSSFARQPLSAIPRRKLNHKQLDRDFRRPKIRPNANLRAGLQKAESGRHTRKKPGTGDSR